MLTPYARDRALKGLRHKIRTQPANIPLLLTGTEVAALFRVNPRTVKGWAVTGKMPVVRTLGGHRRYPWNAVKRHLQLLEIEVPS